MGGVSFRQLRRLNCSDPWIAVPATLISGVIIAVLTQVF